MTFPDRLNKKRERSFGWLITRKLRIFYSFLNVFFVKLNDLKHFFEGELFPFISLHAQALNFEKLLIN